MKKHSFEDIKKAYASLPEDLIEAGSSVQTTEALRDIGKKYGLMMDQAGEMASEAGSVILGLTPVQEFVPNLQERLGVSKDIATKIAEDISAQVFSKVRESMKKIHSTHGGDQALLEVKENAPAEKKDDVLKHLDEDAEIEKDLKTMVVSKNTEEEKKRFPVSDLINASLGLESREREESFPINDLINASLPPENLPINGSSNLPRQEKTSSTPVPKPPVKPAVPQITRMPKEEKTLNVPLKTKDPYREPIS